MGLSVLVVTALACGTGSLTPEELVAQYGGDIADYRRLAASTDCEYLLNEEARGQNNLEDFGDRRWEGRFWKLILAYIVRSRLAALEFVPDSLAWSVGFLFESLWVAVSSTSS